MKRKVCSQEDLQCLDFKIWQWGGKSVNGLPKVPSYLQSLIEMWIHPGNGYTLEDYPWWSQTHIGTDNFNTSHMHMVDLSVHINLFTVTNV